MALKTSGKKKKGALTLFEAAEQAASGEGPRATTCGDLVVRRDGFHCVIEVARGKWMTFQGARDTIFFPIQEFLKVRRYRRVEIALETIAPAGSKGGSFGPGHKEHMKLLAWMGGNVTGKSEAQIQREGYRWRIRLRVGK